MLDYIRDPAEITRRSFELIAAEFDLSALPADMRAIAIRIVHASGMPEILADFRFSPGAGAAGRAAVQAGATLICDARMVAAGIMANRLPARNPILVGLDAAGADDLAKVTGQTRSAAGIERIADRLGGAVVVIGNAPTALFRLLELVAAGAPQPALVLGFPVGFVGAAESKAALAANGLGLPFVTLLGRRGGSAMASAAVNALLLDIEQGGKPGRGAPHSSMRASGSSPGTGEAESAHSAEPGEGRSPTSGAPDPHSLAFRESASPILGEESAALPLRQRAHAAEVRAPSDSRHEGQTPWLSIVGIGEDGFAGLTAAARTLIESAEIVIGAERHFARMPAAPAGQERILWTSPIAETTGRVLAMRGRRVAVLATGDPMHYGIGATIAGRVPREEVTVVPHVSSFALAAARLLWPLQRTNLLSVHGRPVECLAPHVTPDARLLILAHDGHTPGRIAAMLNARGFGESRMTALAHMGGVLESRSTAPARAWTIEVPDLHVLAVECVAGPGASWLPRMAGLPDEAFEHDGKLTKREARALALAKLKPLPDALLWDIGAGCGSVSVEWMRAADRARAISLEPVAARRALAAHNAAALGVPGLDIRDGHAPDALDGLPPPDAVFLGGGISAATIQACRAALKPGGQLVAHAVTLESEAVLLAAHADAGGELVRLSVARAEPVGPFSGWRPAMPVTQWAWTKP